MKSKGIHSDYLWYKVKSKPDFNVMVLKHAHKKVAFIYHVASHFVFY